MKTTQRVRRAGLATMAALVIGGSGVAVGTASQADPGTTATTASTAARRPRPTPRPATFAGPASYAGVVKKVLPSVVLIRTADGLGSGVVLDTKGNIVTNAHVAGNATEVPGPGGRGHLPAVRQAGRQLPARRPRGDPRRQPGAGCGPPRSATRTRPRRATWCWPSATRSACPAASPRASSRPPTGPSPSRPTDGASAATLPGAIQTSAPINPGNSGGALVSASAQVIGIPTLAAGSPQGGGQAQGIGFAIPSNLARDIATQLIDTGHVTNSHRAAIGAEVSTVLGPDGAAGSGPGSAW